MKLEHFVYVIDHYKIPSHKHIPQQKFVDKCEWRDVQLLTIFKFTTHYALGWGGACIIWQQDINHAKLILQHIKDTEILFV